MESHNAARSREGHAALAGASDKWVSIQENTFKNWVNEQLRTSGQLVNDLVTDFEDGKKLCALVEALQGKRVKSINNTSNHHQKLANVGTALTAVANDNIKLVNIGPEDIVNGNKKLILGLIWHLILRYQIGKSKFPTKKLMIAWLQAVIPECNIQNFTTDWNDGVALHALIDFCKPGLCPNWKHLSRSDSLTNCQDAMMLAKQHFDIPLVVRPEDLSSSDLDELSGMTYLSYFMKLDSPGYNATLNIVRRLLKSGTVNNFTSDWRDGHLLCKLVHSAGGHVAEWPTLSGDPVHNMQLGLDGARGLGIEPLLPAHDMVDPEVDHIAIMAYAAYFLRYKPVKTAAEKVVFTSLPQNVSVKQKANFAIGLEDDDVSDGNIKAEIIGPDLEKHSVNFTWMGKTGQGFFVPTEIGLHKLNVYCDGQLVNGCPASFKVLADRSKVTFNTIDQCALGTLTELKVNGSAAGEGDVKIQVCSPSGHSSFLNTMPRQGGYYVSNFNPTEVGDWLVSVMLDNEHVSGSPYTISVFDPALVKVCGLKGGTLGSRITFNVDATHAGKGKTRLEIVHDGVDFTKHCTVHEDKPGFYKINFNVPAPGSYKVHVFFNNVEVQGSPFNIDIVDSSDISVHGDGLGFVSVGRTATFEIHASGSIAEKLKVNITSSKGHTVPHTVKNGAGDIKVEYVPKDVGDHKIEIKYAGKEVHGSPFIAKAYNTDAIKVTKLPDGVVGQKTEFGIDITKAGEGQLEIMVNNGDIPNAVELDELGIYRITFVPEVAGTQIVHIVFNKENHPASPFTCNVIDLSAASVRSLEHHSVIGKTASFYLHSENLVEDLNISISVLSPSGDQVTANVSRQSNGEYMVEWMPHMAGRHTIDIQIGGRQIKGSPFYVDVFDLSTIRVDNFRNAKVGDKAGFTVDFSRAGALSPEVEIIGPSGVGVLYDTRAYDNMCTEYIYEPEEPGEYQIYIKFSSFLLPGCPYMQSISDAGLPSARGRGLFLAEEDNPAHFNVEVGHRKGDLRVTVSGPNSVAKCIVDPQSDGSYDVTYIPMETGIFDINVTWNDQDIPESPYHPKVINARKVLIVGGWQHFLDSNEKINLVIGERKELPFDISEAGPGTLKSEVKGPSRSLDVTIDNHTTGKSVVEFVPEEEGTHYIYLTWSDVPLTNSPLLGFAVAHTHDATKLILTGHGLKYAVVREEAEFIIDGSHAGIGKPEVVLNGVRAEINVQVSALGNRKFHCSYVPKIPGAYLLHITWNGHQLRGSPYKVNVLDAFYPNQVFVAGESLKGGILGRAMDVIIDTRKAGSGELSAQCMGPHQVAYCELQDNRDGTFRLLIKPQEQGRHVLQVKYGGEHVQGSPFVLKVTSQPDASKVRVHGPGVEHGILATYGSQFLVETSGAGAGQLTVRIRGPKGAFQVEMYRDSQRDRTILCKYDPVECGLYIIGVKWSGVDVPGSPFQVYILDTQEELEQVLSETSYANGVVPIRGHSQRSQPSLRMAYSQWREQI